MIEDESHDAALVQHTLKAGGFDFAFKCVETEGAFLRALERFEPSVILSDHGLPAFDGFAAVAIAAARGPAAGPALARRGQAVAVHRTKDAAAGRGGSGRGNRRHAFAVRRQACGASDRP